MRYILLLFFVFTSATTLQAQEVLCNVRVMANQIQSSDKQKFQTLQTAIREFVNNKKWTTDVFKSDERIECNIMINVTEELSSDHFKGTIQVQSSRPIFNSSYHSPLINFIDQDFEFKYMQHQNLEFNENTHVSNLTSVISFYVYLMIGLDYYTFSHDGGVTYLQKAQSIVNNAQSASERGWKAFESNKNRYWMAEELLDAKYNSFTEALYNYHRVGLDAMYDDTDKGRAAITESLEMLRKVKRQNPTAFILQLFFDAKSQEIANIYSQAFPDEQARVINLLTELDPANISKYNKIKENSQQQDKGMGDFPQSQPRR
jgi:hypothetical protein